MKGTLEVINSSLLSKGIHSISEGNGSYGVFGEASGGSFIGIGQKSIHSAGVKGYASNTDNILNFGGHFEAMGSFGRGVYGKA